MSYIYKRIEGAKGGEPRYTRNNIMVKAIKVPHEVKEKLDLGVPSVEIEKPDKACTICDDKATTQRYYNGVMVDLCKYHYYNLSLGAIAKYLREKEIEDGLKAKVPKVSSKKRKSQSRQRQDVR